MPSASIEHQQASEQQSIQTWRSFVISDFFHLSRLGGGEQMDTWTFPCLRINPYGSDWQSAEGPELLFLEIHCPSAKYGCIGGVPSPDCSGCMNHFDLSMLVLKSLHRRRAVLELSPPLSVKCPLLGGWVGLRASQIKTLEISLSDTI